MIEVRTAVRRDAAAIAESQVLMARETEGLALDPPTVARGVAAVFDDPAKGTYYVAEDGGRLAGCLLITPEWSDWRSGWIWWIQSVYVAPEARRRGVYRALYAHVRRLAAADINVCGIRLYVDKRNARAQEVYRSLGMCGDHYQVFEWIKGAGGNNGESRIANRE
jgi:ribosomal protein S18 acetylase RimI-like enzyme